MKKQNPIRYSLLYLFLISCIALPVSGTAVEHDLKGQVSGWYIESNDNDARLYNVGLRYIPQYGITYYIDDERLLEFDISLNAFAYTGSRSQADTIDVDIYRLKFRYATAQTETRIGLQKITFGPAYLLRSLMWFARIDPRDPLQLTEGVYGLRLRYDASNNASLWFWGLYGNDEPKGYDFLPSVDDMPELGGRLEYPMLRGDVAFTFHTRHVNASAFGIEDFTENRFALDGRWDIEIGFWFESVLQQQRAELIPYEWAKFLTLGMDYTFGIGNGLYFLFEHMAAVLSEEFSGSDEVEQASAYMLNYPIGHLDRIAAIGFYSWDSERYHQYFEWQRTWDMLILSLSAFYNTDSESESDFFERTTLATGYGGRIMIIYNH